MPSGLLDQPPQPHVPINPIEVEYPCRNSDLIFDNELSAGFDAWEFGERIERQPDIGPNSEKGLFGERFGNAGINLPGNGDDLLRPNEIGEGNII